MQCRIHCVCIGGWGVLWWTVKFRVSTNNRKWSSDQYNRPSRCRAIGVKGHWSDVNAYWVIGLFYVVVDPLASPAYLILSRFYLSATRQSLHASRQVGSGMRSQLVVWNRAVWRLLFRESIQENIWFSVRSLPTLKQNRWTFWIISLRSDCGAITN